MPKIGYRHTEEARRKISEAGIGRKASEETRKKISLSHIGNKYGLGNRNRVGKHLSKEHKLKISLFNRNKVVSQETRKKLSLALSGEKNPMWGKISPTRGKKRPQITGAKNPSWKGGVTPENIKIRNSMEYSQWRSDIFEKDRYVCQKCGAHSNKLRAHHLESFDNNPERRTRIENGVTLCKECHQNFHHIFGRGNNTVKQFTDFMKNFPCHS